MRPNTLIGYKSFIGMLFPLVLFVMLLCGCQEKVFTGDVDCNQCDPDEPDSAALNIDITVNDRYPVVPLVVYREEFEKDLVDWIDTATTSDYWIRVAIDREYSVKVEYAYNSDTIFVIDATRIKAKKVSDECDEVCWVVVHDRIDARLKF